MAGCSCRMEDNFTMQSISVAPELVNGRRGQRCEPGRSAGNGRSLAGKVGSASGEFEKTARQLGAGAGILVLEEYVGILPALRSNPLDPFAKLPGGIALAPQAHVAPFCGADDIRDRSIVRIGNA